MFEVVSDFIGTLFVIEELHHHAEKRGAVSLLCVTEDTAFGYGEEDTVHTQALHIARLRIFVALATGEDGSETDLQPADEERTRYEVLAEVGEPGIYTPHHGEGHCRYLLHVVRYLLFVEGFASQPWLLARLAVEDTAECLQIRRVVAAVVAVHRLYGMAELAEGEVCAVAHRTAQPAPFGQQVHGRFVGECCFHDGGAVIAVFFHCLPHPAQRLR